MTSSAGRSERTSPLPAPAKGAFAPIPRGKKRKRQTFFKKALAIARKMWYHTQVDTTSGRLAQLVEHLLDVQEVTGSSPVPSTIQFVLEPDSLRKRVRVRFLFIGGFAESSSHWGQSLRTCVLRACTSPARCNTLDFLPKSVCQGAAPLWNPCGACTHVRRKMTKFHYIRVFFSW